MPNHFELRLVACPVCARRLPLVRLVALAECPLCQSKHNITPAMIEKLSALHHRRIALVGETSANRERARRRVDIHGSKGRAMNWGITIALLLVQISYLILAMTVLGPIGRNVGAFLVVAGFLWCCLRIACWNLGEVKTPTSARYSGMLLAAPLTAEAIDRALQEAESELQRVRRVGFAESRLIIASWNNAWFSDTQRIRMKHTLHLALTRLAEDLGGRRLTHYHEMIDWLNRLWAAKTGLDICPTGFNCAAIFTVRDYPILLEIDPDGLMNEEGHYLISPRIVIYTAAPPAEVNEVDQPQIAQLRRAIEAAGFRIETPVGAGFIARSTPASTGREEQFAWVHALAPVVLNLAALAAAYGAHPIEPLSYSPGVHPLE